MAPNLVVSFHGGKGPSAINTLLSFPSLKTVLPGAPSMDELRGFILGPESDCNHLYVVNANKNSSAIFCFTSSGGGTYTSGEIFATKGLSHPFDVAFGPDGNLYVSNQDSNQITRYQGASGSNPGSLIGTFGPTFHTLRGIAWAGPVLYAADETAGKSGEVRAYDSDGNPTGVKIHVEDPVHVMYDGSRYLYIGSGSGNSVWVWDTREKINPNPAQVVGSQSPKIDATAGMALPGDGHLYVASRKGSVILQYPIDVSHDPPKAGNGQALSPRLDDSPEFVGAPGMGVYN